MRMAGVLMVLILMMLPAAAQGKSDYSVRVTADTNKTLVGGRIRLLVEASCNSSYMVSMPDFADTSGKIELLKKERTEKEIENGRAVYRYGLVVTSFEPGAYYLPDFPFGFKRSIRDTFMIVYARVPALEFSTVEVKLDEDIKDIKGPLEIARDWTMIFVYAAIGLLVCGAGYYAWRRYGKRERTPVKEERYDPKIPPHILALGQLKKLNADKLWQTGLYKKFYSELTDIIRLYIERRFSINALEMTSEEIIALLAPSIPAPGLLEKLSFILTTADLAKFAKQEPLAEENTKCMNFAIEFIELTREEEAGGDKT